jgi:uncharacterized delta-60 repeat protein
MPNIAEALERRLMLTAAYALDPTWGDGGILTTPFQAPQNVILMPTESGGLIAIAPQQNTLQFFAFTPDGSTDDTFPLDQRSVPVGVDSVRRIIKLDDGKFLAAGKGSGAGSFALTRLNADFTTDTTFGDAGVAQAVMVPDVGNNFAGALDLALQPDGKIVVTGEVGLLAPGDTPELDVARFTADGAADTSFGGGDGLFTLKLPEAQVSDFPAAHGIAVLPGGKILIDATESSADGLLVRINANGTLDTSYDGDGKLVLTGIGAPTRFAPASDGKLYLGGIDALIRLNADGTPDTSFGGGDGRVGLARDNTRLYDLRVDSHDRPVAYWVDTAQPIKGLARFNAADGSGDASFRPGGFFTLPATDFIIFYAPDLFVTSEDIAISGSDDTIWVSGENPRSPVLTIARLTSQENLSLANGRLLVIGSDADDHLTVDRTASEDRVVFDGETKTFAPGAISNGINVDARGGSNSVTVSFDAQCTVTCGDGADSIVTAGGNDLIESGAGNDTVRAGDGDNTIITGDGDNLIVTGDGSQAIATQGGNDTITCGSGGRRISDAGGHNTITLGSAGAFFDDLAVQGDGNNTLTVADSGSRGQSHYILGGGNDDITNGSAAGELCLVDGGGGNNTITTGDANDTIVCVTATGAPPGENVIFSGAGNDIIAGGDGNDTLRGGAGRDTIYGGAGNDLISGGGARDHLAGQEGNDRIYGGAGNDQLDGGAGSDRLFGQAGNDYLIGAGGNDTLDGGVGSDFLHGGAGDDTFFTAGDGAEDTIIAAAGRDTADADAGVDELHGVEV